MAAVILTGEKLPAQFDRLAWGPSGSGAPTGGSGVWNTTSPSWTEDGGATYQAWKNSDNSLATFAGTGGVISVTGSLTAGELTFGADYTLSITGNNSLALGDSFGTISVTNPGDSVTIQGGLSGSGFTSAGQGSLVLAGANSFGSSGLISFKSGTVRLHAATGSLNSNTSLFFSGGGTFILDNAGANHAIAQVLSSPMAQGGDGTIQSLRTTAQNLSLTFFAYGLPGGNAAQGAGTINYVVTGGVNGTQNKISFSNINPGYMGDANFFNGSSFAWYDSNGYLRGISYGTDADTQSVATAPSVNSGVSHLQITSHVTAQTNATFDTIKLNGGSNLTIANGNTVAVDGIMKAGAGNSLVQGGTLASGFNFHDIQGLVVRTDQASDVLTIGSSIVDGTSSATGIIKSGLGKLVLTGNNTYTGSTLVNGGILSIGTVNKVSSPGALGINGGITLTSGTLQYTGGSSAVLDRGFSISGRAGLDITQAASTLTLNGVNGFGETLVKTGLGTVLINGNVNQYTNLEVDAGTAQLAGSGFFTVGGLTINGGLVRLAGTGGDQIDDDAVVYAAAGALLDLSGRNETIHGLTGNGTVANNGSAATTSILGFGYNTTYDHVISNFSGAINDGASGGKISVYKGGGQTQYLNGASTYSGGTTIADGELVAGNSKALGSGTVQVNSGTLLALSGVKLSNKIMLQSEYDHQLKAGETLAHIVDSTYTGGFTPDTTATILDGTASHDGLLQTGFSENTLASNDFNRQSAAYNLQGTGSDIFTLQLSISDISLGSYLAYLDNSGKWVKAVIGNTGGTSSLVFGAYDPALDFHLGYYGVDVATQTVWAVVNHGTEFAVLGANSGSTVVISGTSTYPNGLIVNSGTFIIDENGVVSTGSSNTIVSQTGTDNGTLVVSGTLSNVSATIGQGTDAIGVATVTGSGATWTSTASLVVGAAGAGMLNVQNGGQALAGQVVAGDATGSYGTITVSGAGSYLESSGAEIVIGNLGRGSLNITAGATAADYGATIGSGTGSFGSVTVSGSGSLWESINYLTVGDSGTGSLNIQGGANVTTGQAVVANNAGSVGSITVGGAGSALVNTSTDFAMLVGLGGSGTLTVQGGGSVSNQDAYLGVNSDSSGSAKVTGTGSQWSSSGTLVIGNSGTGSLTVEAAGLVSDANATIGGNAGSVGTAKVTGAGSTWNTDSLLTVGSSGSGSLTVEAAGAVHDTFGVIGYNDTGVGNVTVNGAGSAWTHSSNLFVGYAGSGNLSILSGATVSDVDGVAGYFAGSHGSVLVQGAGSRWNNGSRVGIGVTGSGTLGILAGGVVSGSSVLLGSDAGSYGEATVDGTGSQLNALQTLMVGNSGTGVLTVRAGGAAQSQFGVVAGYAGSQGTATVTGGGSQWNIDQGFYVGDGGTGVANILAGGHVTSAGGIIAQDGFGVVNVDGVGSQWSGSADIGIGASGTGALNITNGATVTVNGGTGAVLLAQQAGSVGTLQIGQGQSAGTLQASSIMGGQGMATLGFNFSGTTLSFGSQLSGALNVVKDGFGTTVLTGSNQQTGDILVNSGTLRLGNAMALGSSSNTLTLNGGALDLFAKSVTVGALSGSGGVVTSGTKGAVTLNVAQDTDTLFAGSIQNGSGILSLAKSGTGTLALAGSSNYSGATTVTGGFLQLSANNNLGASALTINGAGLRFGTAFADLRGFVSGSNGAALDSNGLNVGTTGAISGPGSLTKIGLGSLTLSGANTYTGGTVLDQGTLILGSTKALGAVTNTLLINNGALDLNGQSATTGALSGGGIITNNKTSSTGVLNTTVNGTSEYDGILADGLGLVGLTKSGTGTLILTADNTHSGPTTISAGILQLGNGGSTGALGTSNIVNNATLDVNRSDALGFTNAISGSGKLIKDGSGVLILSGSSSYTGGTVLNSGLLQLGNAKALGATTSDLTVNGGVLNLNGNSVTGGLLSGTGGAIAGHGAGEASDETLTVSSSKSSTFAGSLNETGPMFTQITGTLSIVQYNSSTTSSDGGTDVSITVSGTVSHGPGNYVVNPSTTGYTPGSNIIFNDESRVVLASSTFTPISYYSATSSLGTFGTVGVKDFSISGSNTLGTDSGSTTGTVNIPGEQGLSLIKAGTGTLTLSGSSNYHGGTTLSAGGLNLANANAIGTGALTISGVTTLDNTSGATLALATNNAQNWNANFTFRGSSDLDLGTGNILLGVTGKNPVETITVTASTLTVGGAISSGTVVTGLTKAGAGTLLLTGNSNYGGMTTISAGVLQLGNGGTSGSLGTGAVVDSATFAINRSDNITVGNIISGVGKLQKDGAGTLTLLAPNFYSGGTILNNGKLVLGYATALGSTSGDFAVSSPGVLDLNGFTVTFGSLAGAGTVTNDATAAAKLTTNTTKSGTFAGSLMDGSGGGTVAFEKAGTGTLTLSGSNGHSGGTILSGGGLNLANANALGSGTLTISGVTTLDNTSGAALALAQNNAQNWNSNFTFKGSSDLDLGIGNVLMSASRTVTVAANTLTVGGAISGSTAVGLTKAGAGTLILTGNSNYGGVTTISAGVLQLGNGGTSGSLGNGAVVDSTTFAINRSDNITVGNIISGVGKLQKDGAGTLTLLAPNLYSGGTLLNNGKLVLGYATALGSTSGDFTVSSPGVLDLNGFNATIGSLAGAGTVTNDATAAAKLTTNTTKSGTFAGSLVDGVGGGTVSFEKAGTGTLTLSGSNGHSGGTKLSGGSLNLANANALGSGTFTISGVTTLDNTSGMALALVTNNAQLWSSNFTFKGSSDLDLGTGNVLMSLAGKNPVETITVTANTLTVGGAISSGTVVTGLTKAGAGTLLLTGNSNYGGVTTISAGVLQLGNGGTSGSLGNGAVVDSTTFAINRSDNITVGNIISGAGRLEKDGAGTLTLLAPNFYSGGTLLNNGKLVLGYAAALGSTSGDLTVSSPGMLDLNGFTVTVGSLTGAGTVTNGSGLASKLTSNTTKSGTFAGSLMDGSGGGTVAFEKAGTGTLTLSGSNNFSGGFILSSGVLNLANANALGTGKVTYAGTATYDNTSSSVLTLATNNAQAWNANFTFKGSSALDLGTGDVTMSATRTVTVASSTLTVGGNISGTTATTGLTKSGTGALILTGANTYTGITTISQGTLQLGNGGTTGSLGAGAIANAATFGINRSDDLTFANVISGAGKFVKDGIGALTLGGTNTYSGGTTINTGKLVLGNAKAIGAATGDLTVNSPGMLDVNGFSVTIGSLSGAGTVTNGAGLAAKLTSNTTKSGTFSGMLQDGTGALSFEKAGTGALTLSGSNAYRGGTTLSGGGLNLANTDAIGSGTLTISGVTTLDNTSGAALALAKNNAQNWNANFTYKGSADLDLGTGNVLLGLTGKNPVETVTVTAHTLTVGGVISSIATNTGLTKAGAGTLILANDNTYTGATTVSAGTLQIGNGGSTGSLASTSISDGSIVAYNRRGTMAYAGAISGKGSVQFAGSGTYKMSGANTYSGGTVMKAGQLVVGSAKALGTGNLTLQSGILATDGAQHQINVGGNLLWDTDAKISLNLAGLTTTDTVNVAGNLVEQHNGVTLNDGVMTFIFDDTITDSGTFTVMTVAKGFGSLTASDFTFESNVVGFDGHFDINGKQLIFVNTTASVGGVGGMSATFDATGGSTSDLITSDLGGVTFDALGYNSGSGQLRSFSVGAVPEPSTWALLLGGGLALLWSGRKLRRA